MDKGRCNACKTMCFNLNFAAQKIKMSILDVPDSLQLKTIEVYLKKDIKSMLFFTLVDFGLRYTAPLIIQIIFLLKKDTFLV